MVASLHSECHICGMSSHAPTRHEPGNHYDTHTTADPQSTNVTETGSPTTSTSSTPDMNMCRYTHTNTDKTPTRPTAPHGTPCVVGLPATSHKMHTYVTCPAQGSSTTKVQVPTPQPVILHGHETRTLPTQTPSRADTFNPPPTLMQTVPTPIESRLHGGDGGCLAPRLPLNTRNAFPDPWSSEVAHTFPWSVRLGALAETLDRLEQPLLGIPNVTHD